MRRYTLVLIPDEEEGGYKSCDDPSVAAPIGAFRTDDAQEFIL